MGFITAFKFLTMFPLPQRTGKGKEDFGRSLPYFPLVGLVLGILLLVLNYGLQDGITGGHLLHEAEAGHDEQQQ